MTPGEVFADRTHKYAPPPWRMFEALTDERETWLLLRPGEVLPPVLEAVSPTSVVWGSLWSAAPHDVVELTITPDGAGAAVRMVWRTPTPPDERGVGLVRKRLAEAFGAHVRLWVDTGVPPTPA